MTIDLRRTRGDWYAAVLAHGTGVMLFVSVTCESKRAANAVALKWIKMEGLPCTV